MDLSVTIARRSLGQAAWAKFWAVLGWPARVVAARRVMLQLGQMSAHELKDIGLAPQDLSDVRALPLDADPTHILARRARERRSPRQG